MIKFAEEQKIHKIYWQVKESGKLKINNYKMVLIIQNKKDKCSGIKRVLYLIK